MPSGPIRTPREEFWIPLLGACFALFVLVGDIVTARPTPSWYRLLLAAAILVLPCVALWRLRR